MLSLVLRLLCGDSLMKIAPTISFGKISDGVTMCDGELCEGEVPFRTIVTLIGIVS